MLLLVTTIFPAWVDAGPADAADAGGVNVRVVVDSLSSNSNCWEDDICGSGDPDFYIVANIGEAVDRTPTRDDTPTINNEELSVPVDVSNGIPQDVLVEVAAYDEDDTFRGGDDRVDLDPQPHRTEVDIRVDLRTCDLSENADFLIEDPAARKCGTTFESAGAGDNGATIQLKIELDESDFDGDGLPDAHELSEDLAAKGADPCRKTVAVEIDYMEDTGHSHRPKDDAMTTVKDAFANAPVAASTSCPFPGFPATTGFPNPAFGVQLLIDVDEAVPEEQGIFTDGRDVMREFQSANMERSRWRFWHYSLWVHDLTPWKAASNIGQCCGPGGGFLIGLGNVPDQGSVTLQAATFMHELGHGIGLRHGGDSDSVNFKPNYLSIMNYAFAGGLLDTATGNTIVDYSRSALPTLDETALQEGQPLMSGSTMATAWTDAQFNLRQGTLGGAFDWSGDGTISSTPVNVDVNGDGICVSQGAPSGISTQPAGDDVLRTGLAGGRSLITPGADLTCNTTAGPGDQQTLAVGASVPRLLTGYDDWANLVYRDVRTAQDVASQAFTPAHPQPDPTYEDHQRLDAFWSAFTNRRPEVTVGVDPLVLEGNTSGGWSGTITATLAQVSVHDPDDDPSEVALGNNAPTLLPLGDTTVTWTATDPSGATARKTQTVRVRDTTAPVNVKGALSRLPDSNGWYNRPLSVTFTADDVTSGIDSCSTVRYGGPDTGGALIRGTCTDRAGNTASGDFALRYDSTAPTTSVHADEDVQVAVLIGGAAITGAAVDNLSGVASTRVTFTSPFLGSVTRQATCTSGCGTTAVRWTVSTRGLLGLYFVTARSTDLAGNVGPVSTPLLGSVTAGL